MKVASNFIHQLPHNAARPLLEKWIHSQLNKIILCDTKKITAEDFRNNILHATVQNNLPTAAKALLTVGAVADARDADGQTSLLSAARLGHKPVVRAVVGTQGH